MKMKQFLLAACVAGLLAVGCGKRQRAGCTDPASPNYDERATVDDGSCGDAAEQWAGTYSATDTIMEWSFVTGEYITTVRHGALVIERLDAGHVTVDGLFGGGKWTGLVSDTRLSWVEDLDNDLFALDCRRDGEAVSYVLPRNLGTGDWDTLKGRAVRD